MIREITSEDEGEICKIRLWEESRNTGKHCLKITMYPPDQTA